MTIPSSTHPARRPFPVHPHIDRYFPARSIEEARQRLGRAIERGDGPGLLVGASGTGKTLLLEVLGAQFCNQFDVAMLFSAQLCTRRALLQAILFELELPYRYHDEGELRLTLLDYLLRSERCPNGILLLVDEAQSLPVRLLEEIRLMSNLVREGQPRVRVVLAGGPSIEELFARSEMETFQQRIGVRCYLGPLSRSETHQYVRAHLAAAEVSAEATFDGEALDAVFEATDGVPRLINQLCDHALLLGPQRPISRGDVQAAWADLQQLPVPWQTHPEVLATAPVETIIEFGELAQTPDEDELAPPAESWLQNLAPECAAHSDLCEIECGGSEPEVLEPTILDEDDDADAAILVAEKPSVAVHAGATPAPAPAHQAATQEPEPKTMGRNRAPVRSGAQPPARDPFGESFEDEEVVLESFPVLGDALGAWTPRVAELSAGERMSDAVARVLTVAAHQADASSESYEATPICDELAPPPLQAVPLVKSFVELSTATEGYCDPVFPEEELSLAQEATELASDVATIRYPGPEVEPDFGVLSIATARDGADEALIELDAPDEPDEEEDILIVEDSPSDAVPAEGGVHRQDYRQLFANLRRK